MNKISLIDINIFTHHSSKETSSHAVIHVKKEGANYDEHQNPLVYIQVVQNGNQRGRVGVLIVQLTVAMEGLPSYLLIDLDDCSWHFRIYIKNRYMS